MDERFLGDNLYITQVNKHEDHGHDELGRRLGEEFRL